MKISTNIFVGLFSPVFYYFVMHLMLLWEYNGKYAMVQNVLLFVLPAIPGIALAILLIRNSLREFFKYWGICFLTSLCVILIHNILRVDLMIYTYLTGYEEFALGEGFLMAVMSISYITSCSGGTIIAGITSLCKQKRSNSMKNKVQ